MRLEDYFDFLAPNDIRIKGSRIGIETVLLDYLEKGKTPEQIQQEYPARSLEQIYATILFYLHDKEKVGAYLQEYIDYCESSREEYEKNLPPVVKRLRRLKAALESYRGTEKAAS